MRSRPTNSDNMERGLDPSSDLRLDGSYSCLPVSQSVDKICPALRSFPGGGQAFF